MTMTSLFTGLLFSMVLLLTQASSAAPVSVDLLWGIKHLSDEEWSPNERQQALGFHVETAPSTLPFRLTFDFLESSEDQRGYVPRLNRDANVASVVTEYSFGIRRYFTDFLKGRPYVGGGPVYARLHHRIEDAALGSEGKADAFGGFAEVGILFSPYRGWRWGVGARHSKTYPTRLYERSFRGGGTSLLLQGGYSFGGGKR